MIVCPQCGEANPERFRLCGMCGAPLAEASTPREVRKTVTILFSDLKGSTSLGERLDSESLREALSLYFDEMRAVIVRHGGTIEKYIGDAIMAVFGLPAVHEDDAIRAVRAASEMQRRLVEVNATLGARWGIGLENRTGVNTGEVVAGDPTTGQRLVTGDTVNTAARLEQAAGAGEVLIGPLTRELVKDVTALEPVEPLDLKGKAERVPAYRLVEVRAADATHHRFEGPLVGRDRELEQLEAAAAIAADRRRARLVTVLGNPGVGKSRLIDEFVTAAALSVRSLRGRCLAYGDGITFWPIVEMVRSAAAIEDDLPADAARLRLVALCDGRQRIADRLAPLLGLSEARHPLEEIFWAVRELFETLAAAGTLVVIVEDLHRAESTLFDLIEHILEGATAPILLLCSARPDLVDLRPIWEGRSDAERIDLHPLTTSQTETVVANLLGASGLPLELTDRLLRAAEGNPLFVEQTLSMLVDMGLLRRLPDGGWDITGDVASIGVPPNLLALVDARVDGLAAQPRSVLQTAAVIGLVFYQGAVRSLVPEGPQSSVDDALGLLGRRQFIRDDPSTFVSERAFRFDHPLIHDAAYRSLLKRDRARLHEGVATWLESIAGHRVVELEEIIGYHLEQSASLLAQLGPLDPAARGTAGRGAARLSSAGRRASARGDSPAAVTLLRRAASLLEPGSRGRIEIELDLAESLASLGEFERSEAVAAEAEVGAARLGDELLAENARLVGLFLRYTLDPQGRTDEVLRETAAAIPQLEAARDHPGLVRAWRLLGWVHGTACRYARAAEAVEQAVRYARKTNDRRAETRNLMSLALAALYGPMPVPRAIQLADRITADVDGDRVAEGVALCASAHLRALQGDFVEARVRYRRARTQLEELGGKMMAATVSLDSGRIELLAGDLGAAERELRHDYEVLAAAGERYTLSTLAGLLADALLRQGRLGAALEMVDVAKDTAADDDVESQCLWRRHMATLLVARGQPENARVLGHEALALIEGSDALVLTGEIRTVLGSIEHAVGDRDTAVSHWRAAQRLFAEKGASVLVASVARMLSESGDHEDARG